MLLEFGARNFFSFKEGFCLSLELNGNCPESISKGANVSKILCVKGANASGKTNALRALAFIKYLCTESYSAAPKSEMPFDCFFENTESTNLFCRFFLDGEKYLYEVELNKKGIISEELSLDDSSKYIFQRKQTELKYDEEKFGDIAPLKVRNNVSVIHSAKQAEICSLDKFFTYFDNILTNVTDYGLSDFVSDTSSVCEVYKKNPNLFSKVKSFLKKADVGIVDVKIGRTINPNGNIQYYPVFMHEVEGKKFPVVMWHESSGTRKLFYDLFLYYITLERGGVLLADEFDINLHPDILPMLIDLFESEEDNSKKAQMIFSTHDTSIMDRLGKYRTYLVNKVENESFGYRLDEIPGDILNADLRNDRPISQWYRKGKLGGVPRANGLQG